MSWAVLVLCYVMYRADVSGDQCSDGGERGRGLCAVCSENPQQDRIRYGTAVFVISLTMVFFILNVLNVNKLNALDICCQLTKPGEQQEH